MPMRETEAMVLRSHPLGESDRIVTFLTRPTDTEVAVVRLRVQPQPGAAFDAADLMSDSAHPLASEAREPTTAMLRRLEHRWAPAERLRSPHVRGAVTVDADELAELGSSSLATNGSARIGRRRSPPDSCSASTGRSHSATTR